MSTIGHPLSDLLNMCTPYFMAQDTTMTKQLHDFSAFKPGVTPGLPTKEQLIGWYSEVAGWDPVPDLPWGLAFHFFRAAGIYQGIAARYAVRQASSPKAKENAENRHPQSEMAWKYVQRARSLVEGEAKL